MKALLFALTAIVSGSAFAGEFTQIGKIEFQSASAFISGNNVCQKGGVLFHKTKAALETEVCTGGREGNAHCRIVTSPLAQPMHSTREICVANGGHDGQCRAWKTVAYNQTSYNVEVYASRRSMESGAAALKTYTYAIPACKVVAPTPAN